MLVRPVLPLRHDDLEAEPAGVLEHGGAICRLNMFHQLYPVMRSAQQTRQRCLSVDQRIAARSAREPDTCHVATVEIISPPTNLVLGGGSECLQRGRFEQRAITHSCARPFDDPHCQQADGRVLFISMALRFPAAAPAEPWR